jgi:hypothetical protein
MSSTIKKQEDVVSTLEIPRESWGKFLETFSRRHQGWFIRLETSDRVTGEDVFSPETLLESVELDLEDEKSPRINVIARLDNKVFKHILFLPSRLILEWADHDRELSLHVTTVNTETTIWLRASAPPAP